MAPASNIAQACATAFLNARFDYDAEGHPPARVPYAHARAITQFSIIEEDAALGRLIHQEGHGETHV